MLVFFKINHSLIQLQYFVTPVICLDAFDISVALGLFDNGHGRLDEVAE